MSRRQTVFFSQNLLRKLNSLLECMLPFNSHNKIVTFYKKIYEGTDDERKKEILYIKCGKVRKPETKRMGEKKRKRKKEKKNKEVLYSEVKSLKSHSFLLPVA